MPGAWASFNERGVSIGRRLARGFHSPHPPNAIASKWPTVNQSEIGHWSDVSPTAHPYDVVGIRKLLASFVAKKWSVMCNRLSRWLDVFVKPRNGCLENERPNPA
jgi:hypothetical protein